MPDINNKIFIDSFNEIAEEINATAIEKGWWKGARNEGELLMLIVSELAEGLEGLRKDLDSDHIPGFKMIEEELADAIIRIMDYGHDFRYRVAEALVEKIKFNKTRPHKHGGKKF